MKTHPVLGMIPASCQAAFMAYLSLKDMSLSSCSLLLGLKRNALGMYLRDGDVPDYVANGLKKLGVPEQLCPPSAPRGTVKIARIVEEHAAMNAGKLAADRVQ